MFPAAVDGLELEPFGITATSGLLGNWPGAVPSQLHNLAVL